MSKRKKTKKINILKLDTRLMHLKRCHCLCSHGWGVYKWKIISNLSNVYKKMKKKNLKKIPGLETHLTHLKLVCCTSSQAQAAAASTIDGKLIAGPQVIASRVNTVVTQQHFHSMRLVHVNGHNYLMGYQKFPKFEYMKCEL